MLIDSLGIQSHVVSSSFSGLLDAGNFLGSKSLLSVDGDGGHESLDLRSLDDGSAVLLKHSGDDSLSYIIGLLQVEEGSDLRGSLRSKSLGDRHIGQALNFSGSLSEDDKVEDGEIGADNATSDRLSLSLTHSSGSVARLTSLQEESHSGVGNDTLLHGETLEIVTSGDSEEVASPLFAESLTLNFLRDSLVVEVLENGFIIHFNEFLGTSARECNVELEEVGRRRRKSIDKKKKMKKEKRKSQHKEETGRGEQNLHFLIGFYNHS